MRRERGESSAMSSGFNTDIKVGEHVFHVQTEDRGPNHPIIDTVVYQQGRILHRRASNYEQGADAAPFSAEELRRLVEEQHRSVIESLRSGALDAEIASAEAATQASRPSGIQVQLPPLGKGDLALVIQAQADAWKDEIRFAMRTREQNPTAGAAQ